MIQFRLFYKNQIYLRLILLKLKLKEWLIFDSSLFKTTAGLIGYLIAVIFGALGFHRQRFDLLSKLHRANFLDLANINAEKLVMEAVAAKSGNQPVNSILRDHVAEVVATSRTLKFFDDPAKLLGPMVIVLKAPTSDEKGVLLLQYSYTFPLFAKRFNINKIMQKYHIVLEPDWSGYCDSNILCYTQFGSPVFVEAFEHRDSIFISNLKSNLVSVPTSTNWWVDYRLFYPLTTIKKDIDVVMVAGWGEYKRHHMFFRAVRRLRRIGRKLRVLLLGYPISFDKDLLLNLARNYKISEQLEIHEWVPYEHMNQHINRAKINIIWSRKEGVNRAIIEGMFSGVPCILREGFNYGQQYPYINPNTGCYANDHNLPEKLTWLIGHYQQFAPRKWVVDHMSAQRATVLLSEVIGRTVKMHGENWAGNLSVKVNKLHNMEYWDPQDKERFAPDYEFLKKAIIS